LSKAYFFQGFSCTEVIKWQAYKHGDQDCQSTRLDFEE